jgi:chemotaxis protein CheX
LTSIRAAGGIGRHGFTVAGTWRQEFDMDVRFINPFVSAIMAVFKTMVNTDVKVKKPYVMTEPGTRSDVSGVIGFSGDASGCVVLSFPIEVACKAASSFAGVPIDENHPDFSDAIGELANMVAGNAKKDFAGMRVSISLPSVIVGKGHTVSSSKAFPRLVIPCETDFGPFEVEVGVVVEKPGTASGTRPLAAVAG